MTPQQIMLNLNYIRHQLGLSVGAKNIMHRFCFKVTKEEMEEIKRYIRSVQRTTTESEELEKLLADIKIYEVEIIEVDVQHVPHIR